MSVNHHITTLKGNIREYLQLRYSDERLAWLLAHARSGKLCYTSCCCLLGITTADHALRGKQTTPWGIDNHYYRARHGMRAILAENAYAQLGYGYKDIEHIICFTFNEEPIQDARRRRILIPMILAEMRRRDRRIKALTQDSHGRDLVKSARGQALPCTPEVTCA